MPWELVKYQREQTQGEKVHTWERSFIVSQNDMIPKIKSMCGYSKSWFGIKYLPSTAAVFNMVQQRVQLWWWWWWWWWWWTAFSTHFSFSNWSLISSIIFCRCSVDCGSRPTVTDGKQLWTQADSKTLLQKSTLTNLRVSPATIFKSEFIASWFEPRYFTVNSTVFQANGSYQL